MTTSAFAFHADIFLTQQDGTLLTGRGAADPGSGGMSQVGMRFHVNDIAGLVPFVDTNPGLSAEEAGDSFFISGEYQPLPANRTVSFNLKSFRVANGTAANLFYWDGLDAVNFQPVTNANDQLEVRSGTLGSAIATGANADVTGFGFTASDPTGFIHTHLVFDFDVDNSSATPASTGIFLAGFEFAMDLNGDDTIEITRPHYIAWFNGPPGTLKTNTMAAANMFLNDDFAELRLFGDVSPLGEDDLPDDRVNSLDIDALLAATRGGSIDPLFDLNDDATVDAYDVQTLFDIRGTQLGDANLDGLVNGADLILWQENYGTSGGWANGDFNGDATVDGHDFLIWQLHFGFGGNLTAVVAVPEPASIATIGVATLLFMFCSRRDHRAHRGLN
jgi:hypothetical protein